MNGQARGQARLLPWTRSPSRSPSPSSSCSSAWSSSLLRARRARRRLPLRRLDHEPLVRRRTAGPRALPEDDRARALRVALDARARLRRVGDVARRLGAARAGYRPRVLRLPPGEPPRRLPLGGPRRAPPERGVQPVGRAPAALARVDRLAVLLPAAGGPRLPAGDVPRRRDDRHALPVLDPHARHQAPRPARVDHEHAEPPPRPPRDRPAVRRQELRRHLHRVGPPLRHVRARGGRAGVRHREGGLDAGTRWPRTSRTGASSRGCRVRRAPSRTR